MGHNLDIHCEHKSRAELFGDVSRSVTRSYRVSENSIDIWHLMNSKIRPIYGKPNERLRVASICLAINCHMMMEIQVLTHLCG